MSLPVGFKIFLKIYNFSIDDFLFFIISINRDKFKSITRKDFMRYYLTTAIVNKNELEESMGGKILYEELDKKGLVCISDFRYGHRRTEEIDNKLYIYVNYNILLYSDTSTLNTAKWYTKKVLSIFRINDYVGVDAREATYGDDLTKYCDPWCFDGELLRVGNMREMYSFSKSKEFFHDWVCNIKTGKDDIFKDTQKSIHSRDLYKELKRIYISSNSQELGNTPVQYSITGTKQAGFWNSIDILCTALNENNRTKSKHIIHLNFDKVSVIHHYGANYFASNKDLMDGINNNFVNQLSGNIVIIEYGINDDENNFDSISYSCLCKFIEELKPYFLNTTVIFALPFESKETIERIEKLTGYPMVNIAVNRGFDVKNHDYNEIYGYAKKRFEELNLSPDNNFNNMLKDSLRDKSFNDVDTLIEKWRYNKLISTIYPQYNYELSKLNDKNLEKTSSAIEELNDLIGLASVKEHINNILSRFSVNEELKKRGIKVSNFSMHMAFLGNPGTGKTLVARLYGQILKDIGLLSEGRVITVSGADGFNIKKTFEKAKGSVLFIDEAYALCSGCSSLKENSGDTIASLIAEMENNRENTIVIFAGYKNAMHRLFNSNVGFRSRLGCVIEFPDYNQDELLEIYKFMSSKVGLILPEETLHNARDILWRGGRKADQGNARYVRKFLEDCIGRQQVRLIKNSKKNLKKLTNNDLITILPCDLDQTILEEKSGYEQLNELIGLDDVKKFVTERVSQLKIQKLRRDKGIKTNFIPMHMAFAGNPGSGKTEVARIIGKILNEEGLLSNGDFYETHPGELAYIGAFDDLFREARGSVIFIDEAYGIADFPPLMIAELIKNMEDYRDETVVIFAGYTKEINKMISTNPGFESRIKYIINFCDYDVEQLVKIMVYMAKKEHYVIAKSAFNIIREILKNAKSNKRFGNGRFVRSLLEDAIIKQSARLQKERGKSKDLSKYKLTTLLEADFEKHNKIKIENNEIGFIKKIA